MSEWAQWSKGKHNNYTIVRRWGGGGRLVLGRDILRPNTALNSSYNILPPLYVIVEKLEKKDSYGKDMYIHIAEFT